MIRIYKIEKEKFKEAKKVLESDPYSKESFATVGYKLREARSLGLEGEDYYVYVKAGEEIIKKLDEKIKGIAIILEGEEGKKIMELLEKEEEEAQKGFGDIFG